MPATDPPSCTCGKPYQPRHALHGWRPCLCGGHRTIHCRADTGGCGETRHPPELTDDCRDVRLGR